MEYTLEQFADAVGAELTANVMRHATVSHVATDSRSHLVNPAETAFFAIQTDSNDGHRFVVDLYDRGVRIFVVDKPVVLPADAVVLAVSSSLDALQRLGAMVRRDFPGTLVAITGTRGKTTVKEWLNAILSATTEVSRSPRSFNSQIGVPLSLMSLPAAPAVGIIEAGISQRGEMATLERIIRPDITVFTCIDGKEHIDGFRDTAEQLAEKLILAQRTSVFVYDSDGFPDLAALQSLSKAKLISVSQKDTSASLYYQIVNAGERSTTLAVTCGETATLTVPFAMRPYDVRNLMLAVATACHLGVALNVVADVCARLERVNTDIRVIDAVNGATLVYDPFTPDLIGLETALEYALRRTETGRSLVVILGEPCPQPNVWERIGEMLACYGVDRVIPMRGDIAALRRGIGEGPTEITLGYTEEPAVEQGATILAFGRGLESLCAHFEARRHQTVLQVNLNALTRNFRTLRAQAPAGTRMVCMVKAFGYGAGGFQLARTLEDAGADYLAVAAVDEGLDLRSDGIAMPIIVLNPRLDDYRPLFNARLEPTVYSLPLLRRIVDQAVELSLEAYPIHIKLDTGMHRVGFLPDELAEVSRILSSPEAVRAVKVSSVFSHLATADDAAEDDYTLQQINAFTRDCQTLRELLPEPSRGFLRHILNSAGLLRFPQYAFDMVRLGIALYGYNPVADQSRLPLEPVSTLSSVIIALREWDEGTTIGYNRRGRLSRRSVIATVPIGYADGIDRRLGYGNLCVDVAGVACPTVGTVCMDLMMIDVTEAAARHALQVGDTVTIFGSPVQSDAASIATTLATIPYEVLTSVSPRVKRIYYRE